MRKYVLLGMLALMTVALFSFPCPAYAYMDPGTTGSIFAMLAPVLAMIVAFLAFLIRPIRRFFSSIGRRLRRSSKNETLEADEQPLPTNSAVGNEDDGNN